MDRPPRKLSLPLFDRTHIFQGVIDGIIIFGFSMASYVFALSNESSEGTARFIAFITLVLCNLVLIKAKLSSVSVFSGGSSSKNNSFWLISGITIVLLFLIFSFSSAAELFHFAVVPLTDLGFVAAAVGICYLLMEFIKLFKVGVDHASKN